MHHAISFQAETNEYLLSTPRKKLLKHQLINVKQGLVLVKLGKREYALEAGQWFWLPFDTLTSVTYAPNTLTNSVNVSSRVTQRFPKQAGYVNADSLLVALVDRLESLNEHREKQIDLLKVVQSELASLKPELKETKYTQQIGQWQSDRETKISNELKLMLRVREANKQMLSGKKRQAVVNSLFDGDDDLFTHLEHTILGR